MATIQRKAVRLEVLSETAIAFLSVLGAAAADPDPRRAGRRHRPAHAAAAAARRGRCLVAGRNRPGGSCLRPCERPTANACGATLASARRELAVLMGDTAPKFATVSGRLDADGTAPVVPVRRCGHRCEPATCALDRDLCPAQRRTPAGATEAISGRTASRRVGVTSTTTNDDAVRLTLSVPIPVFDQNQGNILSAQESLAKTQAEREANRNTLIVLVAGRAYDSLQGSLRELAVLRETAIPEVPRGGGRYLAGLRPGPLLRCSKCSTPRRASPGAAARAGGSAEFPRCGRDDRRPRRQSIRTGPGEFAMMNRMVRPI